MSAIIDLNHLIQSIPAIAKGIPVTLSMAAIAFIIGSIIGLVTALLRVYRVPVFSRMAVLYVSFIRGTPLLVQIFLIYYGIPVVLRAMDALPYISKIPPTYYLCVAFSLNIGGYLSEIIRASILAVPKGQMEAAYSLGMTTSQALWKVILPQALAAALPSIGNQLLLLVKNTSLAFVIGVPEILGEAKIIAGRTSKIFEVYLVAAMMYWMICVFLERLLILLERYLNRHKGTTL